MGPEVHFNQHNLVIAVVKILIGDKNMRLSVISEVADPRSTNMDGIEISKHDPDITYSFTDPRSPDLLYSVIFEAAEIVYQNCPHYNDIRQVTNENSYKLDLTVAKDGSPNWSFDKTGRGNFAFVYGKLMTCVIDFLITRDVEAPFIVFSGFSKDMELIYKRLMDRLNNEYPDYTYYPYSDGLYISSRAIEKIEDEDIKDEIFEAISSHSRERDERHKMIRKEKQEKNPRSRGNVL